MEQLIKTKETNKQKKSVRVFTVETNVEKKNPTGLQKFSLLLWKIEKKNTRIQIFRMGRTRRSRKFNLSLTTWLLLSRALRVQFRFRSVFVFLSRTYHIYHSLCALTLARRSHLTNTIIIPYALMHSYTLLWN